MFTGEIWDGSPYPGPVLRDSPMGKIPSLLVSQVGWLMQPPRPPRAESTSSTSPFPTAGASIPVPLGVTLDGTMMVASYCTPQMLTSQSPWQAFQLKRKRNRKWNSYPSIPMPSWQLRQALGWGWGTQRKVFLLELLKAIRYHLFFHKICASLQLI